MADPILSGERTYFWSGDRFVWPNDEVKAWSMSWDPDKRGPMPEITDVKARVETPGDDGALVPLGDTFDSELTPDTLFRLGGGRKYKLHLRHKGQSLPHSRIWVDLSAQGEPLPLPGQRRREVEREREPPPPPEPSGPSIDDLLKMGREPIASALGEHDPDERITLGFKLKVLEDQAEFNREYLKATQELLKARENTQAAQTAPLLEALRAQVEELKADLKQERDARLRVEAQSKELQITALRNELVAAGKLPPEAREVQGSKLVDTYGPMLFQMAMEYFGPRILGGASAVAASAPAAAVAAVG